MGQGKIWGCSMSGLKILVLDDEEEMCKSLATLLSVSGYDVRYSTSVTAGLELLGGSFFDIVITDLCFPDGEGFEIMNYCKEHCPKTSVIAMTGYASMDTAIRAIRAGAYDYVVKPFEYELIQYAIERAVEHQRMQDEILLAKDRYHAFVEELNDGYFVLDGRNFVYANRTMGYLMGIDPSMLVGRDILGFCSEESRPVLERHLDKMYRAGGGVTILDEISFEEGGQRPRFVELKLTNVSSVSSRFAGHIVGICRDITERKVLWEKLVKTEKIALLGEMVAGIAHELNNKLTPVLGYAEMLATHNSDEQKKRWLDNLKHSASCAKSIVESLLLFARKEKTEKILCNINEVVRRAVDIVASSFADTSVELECDFALEIEPVLADPFQIEQVVANIAKNAYEAVKGRGKVAVKTTQIDDNVFISISDTGPGIPKAVQERIFEPFFTTKARGKGTGLGLSVCHGIVVEHKGDIALCSPGEGKGTVFSISLPVAKAGEKQTTCKDQEQGVKFCSSEPHGGVRILLVEDEEDITHLLHEALFPQNVVEMASNGAKALDILQKDPSFDLVISDIRMPELDGISLYRKLKKTAPHYCNRIIFTTGMNFDPPIKRFFSDTGVPYIKKPFKLDHLTGMINTMLAMNSGDISHRLQD